MTANDRLRAENDRLRAENEHLRQYAELPVPILEMLLRQIRLAKSTSSGNAP